MTQALLRLEPRVELLEHTVDRQTARIAAAETRGHAPARLRAAGRVSDSHAVERILSRPQRTRALPVPRTGEPVDLYRHVSPKHELVCVEPNDAVVAECDPTRIAQVITNLVSNAIKYSPDGGRVTLTTSTEGSVAVFAVSDEGVGVPLEDHERIFEPFHRCQRSRELVPGVGLGLSVTRKIVAGHGGTLELERRDGGGSTFRIRLPLAPAPRPSPSSRRAKGASSADERLG